jgi:hypothetical protein
MAIIALAAVMAFTACDDGNGGGTNTGTAPAITTTALPGGTAGTAYSQILEATGSTPITWSVDTGALPGGLVLSSAGVISGTPTTAGTSNFTVKAVNSAGSDTKALSIDIISGTETEWPVTLAFENVPNGQSGTWHILIDGDNFIEIRFNNYEESGSFFAYHYYATYNLKSVNSTSFTVEEEDSSAEYTVSYSLNADGKNLTISDNGGLPDLDNGVYRKKGSIVWPPAFVGTWSNQNYSITFTNTTDEYADMSFDENYLRLVEFAPDSFKVLMMNMVFTIRYSLSGDTLTIIDEGDLYMDTEGTYSKN